MVPSLTYAQQCWGLAFNKRLEINKRTITRWTHCVPQIVDENEFFFRGAPFSGGRSQRVFIAALWVLFRCGNGRKNNSMLTTPRDDLHFYN